MARLPEEMAYYAVRDEQGLPRVCHAVTARAPADGVEISAEEARAISAAYRGPRPVEVRPDVPQGLAVAVLNEARDQIVAVVNEASGDRDQKFEELANRVKSLEIVISALERGADNLRGKP